MAATPVKSEISSEDVVNASVVITRLSRHHEQLLRHSTIWLAGALIGYCFSVFGLVVFIFLILNDPGGTSANLPIILRASLPFLFSAGLSLQYDRQQKRAMEVAHQLSKERRLDSARLASLAIENAQARDAVYGRMVEHLITESDEASTISDVVLAKRSC